MWLSSRYLRPRRVLSGMMRRSSHFAGGNRTKMRRLSPAWEREPVRELRTRRRAAATARRPGACASSTSRMYRRAGTSASPLWLCRRPGRHARRRHSDRTGTDRSRGIMGRGAAGARNTSSVSRQAGDLSDQWCTHCRLRRRRGLSRSCSPRFAVDQVADATSLGRYQHQR